MSCAFRRRALENKPIAELRVKNRHVGGRTSELATLALPKQDVTSQATCDGLLPFPLKQILGGFIRIIESSLEVEALNELEASHRPRVGGFTGPQAGQILEDASPPSGIEMEHKHGDAAGQHGKL